LFGFKGSRIPYAFANERKEMVAVSQFDHVEIQSQWSIAPTSRLNLNHHLFVFFTFFNF
jgi:hypothetical protein